MEKNKGGCGTQVDGVGDREHKVIQHQSPEEYPYVENLLNRAL